MPNTNNKIDIINLTAEELFSWFEKNNIKIFHAKQILKWIYAEQKDSFESMTDISKKLRDLLTSNFEINRLKKVETKTSKDQTKKYLFELSDKNYIESVLIPNKNRYTICISTQVGCAQNCKFCLTAKQGFKRNLTKSEIVSQVRDIVNEFNNTKNENTSKKLSNIVFMGMGEPLANYNNVKEAIYTICDEAIGLSFPQRKVTVSTAGLIHKFDDISNDTKANLAISLNATDNKTRSMLMPINDKYPIEEIIKACKNFNLGPKKFITIEYILMKGINDSATDAHNLAKLLSPLKAKINLIPFNEHEKSEFKTPDDKTIDTFQQILMKSNYNTIIRHSKGSDILAACGQLSSRLNTSKILN